MDQPVVSGFVIVFLPDSEGGIAGKWSLHKHALATGYLWIVITTL